MRGFIDGVYRDLTEEEIAEIEKDEQELHSSFAYIHSEIQNLKDELASYDYIGTKIAMGVATKEDYAEQIAYTEQLRKKIRELEKQL